MMHRLFVGIDPPPAIKQQLLAIAGGISAARWQSADQLHLTLRFIGEVDRHAAADIADALGHIRHPAFDIALSGTGMFDRRGKPESLWVGVRPHEPLKALHNKVDQALARVGIAVEARSYLPHITLARLNRETGPIDGFMTRHGGVASELFGVDDFCLYESQLTRDGAVYAIVERYPLSASLASSPRTPASTSR